MVHPEFGKPKSLASRCCSARIALVAGICMAALCCFAAEGSLPSISANDNSSPGGRFDSDAFTLHLELRGGLWHPEAADGRAIDVYSFAEAGHELQTPGPLIRVPQGADLRVSVHNLLPVAAFVHGLHQHPGNPEACVKLAPGETKEVQFSAGEPGSYFYWASTSKGDFEARDLAEGLMSGAFIVDPPGASTADRVFVIQGWARHLFEPSFEAVLSINGKSWPYTERLHARLGEPEQWRIVNATRLEHPMHLHGFYFYVDATGDGETEHVLTAAERHMVVTNAVPPGETFDMTWKPERAGNWIFHCHILDHMTLGYKLPRLYGPDGPPATLEHVHANGGAGMGMSELVLGITVIDDNVRPIPVKQVTQPPAAERHLFVRERPASTYAPAGPGFYLEGVSQRVGVIGPPLIITQGERTAITVTNELDTATAIHWHGLEIESYYDGVPGWDGVTQHTTPSIAPGESFVAYMTPARAGTFIYHTHWHDVEQLTGGMYGPLLVLEPGQKYDPETDKVFVVGRGGPNEMKDPLVVNGSPQPSLMVLLTGHAYRFRFINITPNDHLVATTLVTDGHPGKWRALAKDGADLPPQQTTEQEAVQSVRVGETYDFEFAPKQPGDYELRFCSPLGNEVTQMIAVVPPGSRFSVFAEKR